MLSDGTLARAGGKVIKNVAGYDLGKLFSGSFGTLGLIVEVVVRLHPRPPETVTVRGQTGDEGGLQDAAIALSHAPLEIEALDVSWKRDAGLVLARFGGVAPAGQAKVARAMMEEHGLDVDELEDDAEVWRAQRDSQRSDDGVIIKVSALQTDLAEAVRAARDAGLSLGGRGGLGLFWLSGNGEGWAAPDAQVAAIEGVRARLSPRAAVVLDADPDVRSRVPVWGPDDGFEPASVDVMRAVKARFDPAGVCAPGLFAGGI
jgi:glycolate oxidase FAD binding subunit